MSTSDPITRLRELLPQLLSTEQSQGKAYMQIQLTETQNALLPLDYVHETLLVKSDHITHFPNVNPSIMGLMASRSRVFCAIDLAQLLKLSLPLPSRLQYHTVVVRSEATASQTRDSDAPLVLSGLVIRKVLGMVRVDHESIQPNSTQGFQELDPVIMTHIVIEEQPLPLLDIEKIMQMLASTCPPNRSHS